jgi:hypothetical protein
MANIVVVEEHEIEASPCPECGNDNVFDGAKVGCVTCEDLAYAFLGYQRDKRQATA